MITSIKTEIQSTPKLPTGIKIDVVLSPRHLLEHGFVMPVIIQTPSVLCAPPISNTLKTVQVMALFDTGASRTCISDVIANALVLNSVGFSKFHTASGIEVFADYAVDVLFPNAGLRSFENLKVGSCNMPYAHNLPDVQRMAHDNFGVLIGRDIMARWNIVWNGPSSCVFIAD